MKKILLILMLVMIPLAFAIEESDFNAFDEEAKIDYLLDNPKDLSNPKYQEFAKEHLSESKLDNDKDVNLANEYLQNADITKDKELAQKYFSKQYPDTKFDFQNGKLKWDGEFLNSESGAFFKATDSEHVSSVQEIDGKLIIIEKTPGFEQEIVLEKGTYDGSGTITIDGKDTTISMPPTNGKYSIEVDKEGSITFSSDVATSFNVDGKRIEIPANGKVVRYEQDVFYTKQAVKISDILGKYEVITEPGENLLAFKEPKNPVPDGYKNYINAFEKNGKINVEGRGNVKFNLMDADKPAWGVTYLNGIPHIDNEIYLDNSDSIFNEKVSIEKGQFELDGNKITSANGKITVALKTNYGAKRAISTTLEIEQSEQRGMREALAETYYRKTGLNKNEAIQKATVLAQQKGEDANTIFQVKNNPDEAIIYLNKDGYDKSFNDVVDEARIASEKRRATLLNSMTKVQLSEMAEYKVEILKNADPKLMSESEKTLFNSVKYGDYMTKDNLVKFNLNSQVTAKVGEEFKDTLGGYGDSTLTRVKSATIAAVTFDEQRRFNEIYKKTLLKSFKDLSLEEIKTIGEIEKISHQWDSAFPIGLSRIPVMQQVKSSIDTDDNFQKFRELGAQTIELDVNQDLGVLGQLEIKKTLPTGQWLQYGVGTEHMNNIVTKYEGYEKAKIFENPSLKKLYENAEFSNTVEKVMSSQGEEKTHYITNPDFYGLKNANSLLVTRDGEVIGGIKIKNTDVDGVVKTESLGKAIDDTEAKIEKLKYDFDHLPQVREKDLTNDIYWAEKDSYGRAVAIDESVIKERLNAKDKTGGLSKLWDVADKEGKAAMLQTVSDILFTKSEVPDSTSDASKPVDMIEMYSKGLMDVKGCKGLGCLSFADELRTRPNDAVIEQVKKLNNERQLQIGSATIFGIDNNANTAKLQLEPNQIFDIQTDISNAAFATDFSDIVTQIKKAGVSDDSLIDKVREYATINDNKKVEEMIKHFRPSEDAINNRLIWPLASLYAGGNAKIYEATTGKMVISYTTPLVSLTNYEEFTPEEAQTVKSVIASLENSLR